jgi:DNA repair photolyase
MSGIYEPKGRALEYSLLAVNYYNGCLHGCKYCYARDMARSFGKTFDTGQTVMINNLREIEKDAVTFAGTNKRVLCCFLTDPYQPLNDKEQITRRVLSAFKKNNIPFQILTKGGTRAVNDFDLYGMYDAFASTLTFIDSEKSKEYEPNAALPADRFEAIRIAKSKGIETWASLEPVIEADQSLEIIKQTHEIVDLYKIGTLNHRKSTINWREFGIKAIELCEKYNKKYYIKHDLALKLEGISYKSTDTRTICRQFKEKASA